MGGSGCFFLQLSERIVARLHACGVIKGTEDINLSNITVWRICLEFYPIILRFSDTCVTEVFSEK